MRWSAQLYKIEYLMAFCQVSYADLNVSRLDMPEMATLENLLKPIDPKKNEK
jgi:hypothetical protein